jgi:hypothetical protein
MEENTGLENFDLKLNETAIIFLKEIAKWAYFLSILGYIVIGFIVVGAVFASTIFSAIGDLSEVDDGIETFGSLGGTFITILYLIIAAVYFFPVYYLNKFAVNIRWALKDKNSKQLSDSLEYLKSHYKFIGIMTVVVLALYLLIIVFAVIAGIAYAL